MKVNNKNKIENKASPKKELSPNKKNKKFMERNSLTIQKADKFPKNANEFKHIMDDINCGVPDIEYMLQLRRHKKIANINKNITANSPSFYEDDLQKYKKRITKKGEEYQLLKTNIGRFRQIFSDRSKYAINDTQYKFEVSLRPDTLINQRSIIRNQEIKDPKKIVISNKKSWNPPIIPRSKSLFDTMLPPVLSRSKEIFSRLDDKIGRPLIKVNKEGYINGEKVRRRVFEYNKNIALRYPSEHFPSSKYKNDYGSQNISSIKHLLDFDNRTMTSSWSTYLRNPKKIIFLPEDIKRREKRLRDKSNEKSYPKN